MSLVLTSCNNRHTDHFGFDSFILKEGCLMFGQLKVTPKEKENILRKRRSKLQTREEIKRKLLGNYSDLFIVFIYLGVSRSIFSVKVSYDIKLSHL